jgi:MoaA/NifB/PqqE/SkfB family radical SAM enzyme
VERVSIELTERCGKGCGFCYNGSNRDGDTTWTDGELCAFAVDCVAHGVAALSFGGGEPLEAPELLWPVLAAVRDRAFR